MQVKLIYCFFVILGLAAIVYVTYDIIAISNAVARHQATISYDSGTYYIILFSISWPCLYIEVSARIKGPNTITNNATLVLLIWLIAALLLANVIPRCIEYKLDNHGYKACKDPSQINRRALGQSLIFKLERYE